MNIQYTLQSYGAVFVYFSRLPFVLSGFARPLTSHFGRSFLNHSYRYAPANDQPNCFASDRANSESLVKCPG